METEVTALDTFLRNLRYALRGFRKAPGFSLMAIVTLALGMGANTAIFSVAKSVLLDPLPYPEARRLLRLTETRKDGSEISVSYPNYLDWRDRNRSFESLAAFSGESTTLDGNPAERLNAHVVSGNFFSTLGTPAAVGRPLRPEDDLPGAAPVTVLSHDLWVRRFGADPSVVGRPIRIDGSPRTVVGVIGAGFRFYDYGLPDLWTPIGPWARDPSSDTLERKSHPGLYVIGRLRPASSLVAARTDMSLLRDRLARAYPAENGAHGIKVESFQESVVGEIRPALLVVSGSVVLLLLIACANISNLLLARGVERRREMAIRAAIGADRRTLVGQLLTESLALAALGGAAGVGLATLLLRGIVTARPLEIPRLDEVALDLRMLAGLAAATIVSALLFGLAPALSGARRGEAAARFGAAGRERGRFQSLLIAGETALCLVLLAGSALLVRSFWKLRHVDPGFTMSGILTARIDAPAKGGVADDLFLPRVLEEARRIPGVSSVSAVTPMPLTPANRQDGLLREGAAPVPLDETPVSEVAIVADDYFRTMGIPILHGREFRPSDSAGMPRVAVVSAEAARRFWPGADAIGKRFANELPIPGVAPKWITVIGVARDTRLALDGRPAPIVYHPLAQRSMSRMTVLLRTDRQPPESLAAELAEAVRRVDPRQPLYRVASLETLAGQSLAERRFTLVLLAGFTAIGVLLAAAGIGGVVSRLVSSRRREIGIRMALGATGSRVVSAILGRALAPVAGGIGAGIAAAWALAPALRSLLFGVRPLDAATFALVPVLLAAVALAAALFPARRATRIDPATVLRTE
jgi:putative ABC transport system permease protein